MYINALVGRIALRAGQLSAMTMRELRLTHPDNQDGTVSGSQWQGVSKDDLIEEILVEEFSLEFDIEIPLAEEST